MPTPEPNYSPAQSLPPDVVPTRMNAALDAWLKARGLWADHQAVQTRTFNQAKAAIKRRKGK